jgi:hypothetical protein
VKPCWSEFQGIFKFPAPAVSRRTTATLRLALAERNGKLIHDTSIEVDLFPTEGKAPVLDAVIIGDTAMARQLGLRAVKSADLYIVTDVRRYAARRRAIEAAVEQGAAVLFLELPVGEHTLGGTKVKVEECGMSPRHFVSRATGHPLVADFRPDDFRFWHDPVQGRPSPLLYTLFTAPGWTPILTTGNGGWGGEWQPALAAAELKQGKGSYRLCQVQLAGRMKTNPVARLFASRLLGSCRE